MKQGLCVIHIDGLSHDELTRAIEDGLMPTVASMLEAGYVALPYRCGVPSTTPCAQAGILYGDGASIPGFRWWDRKAGMVVRFGPSASFGQVAHRFFRGRRPLCEGGACIAACYPAGADETFGLSYRDRSYSGPGRNRSAGSVIGPWLANPAHLADMMLHGATAVAGVAAHDLRARATGRPAAQAYVVSDMLEEVLLHHVTRYAMAQAMDTGYPAIYAAFYAYDETAHAFGPGDPYSRRMLRHVDHSIRAAAERTDRYELIVLSDHGQVETVPLRSLAGRALGEIVAGWLPGSRVDEHGGRTYGPERTPQARVVICHSGGLSHVYFAPFPDRLDAGEVRRRFPGLVDRFAATEGVHFVLMRDGQDNLVVTRSRELRFRADDAGQAADLLGQFDDAAVVARQLDRLNRCPDAGDLVLVGRWDGRRQVSFEEQIGGHGSIGGAQLHPFLLVRQRWGVDASNIEFADQLHPVLMGIRRELAGPQKVIANGTPPAKHLPP